MFYLLFSVPPQGFPGSINGTKVSVLKLWIIDESLKVPSVYSC